MYSSTVLQQDFFLYVPDCQEQFQLSCQKKGGKQKEQKVQVPPKRMMDTLWREIALSAELTIYTYRYDDDK